VNMGANVSNGKGPSDSFRAVLSFRLLFFGKLHSQDCRHGIVVTVLNVPRAWDHHEFIPRVKPALNEQPISSGHSFSTGFRQTMAPGAV
jgi:hypothetical protein